MRTMLRYYSAGDFNLLLSAGCGLAIVVYVVYLIENLLALAYGSLTLSRPSIWQCLVEILITLAACTAIVPLSLYFARKADVSLCSSSSHLQSTNTTAHPYCVCGVSREDGLSSRSSPDNQERSTSALLSTDQGNPGGKSSLSPNDAYEVVSESADQDNKTLNSDITSADMPTEEHQTTASSSTSECDETTNGEDEYGGEIEENPLDASLRAAVKNGDKDAVESHDQEHPLSELRSTFWQVLVKDAVQSGHPELVELLMQVSVHPWRLDLRLDEKFVRLVLDSNLVPPGKIFGLHHLFVATISDDIRVLRLLVEVLTPTLSDLIMLLHDAAKHRATEAVRFFLSRGNLKASHFFCPELYLSPLDFRCFNPLAGAVVGGDKEITQEILEHNFDINVGYSDESPPLYLATRHGNLEVLKLLLDLDMRMSPEAPSKLTLLRTALDFEHGDVADYLVDCGVYPAPNEISLRAAVLGRSTKLARFLLTNRNNGLLEHCYHYGSLLQAAAAGRDKKMVQLLIDHGAEVTVSDHIRLGGNGPLMAAVSAGDSELVKMLMDNGADMNDALGCFGNALQTAVTLGNLEVVQVLLNHGFNVNSQVSEFGNALWIAINRRPFDERISCTLAEHEAFISAPLPRPAPY